MATAPDVRPPMPGRGRYRVVGPGVDAILDEEGARQFMVDPRVSSELKPGVTIEELEKPDWLKEVEEHEARQRAEADERAKADNARRAAEKEARAKREAELESERVRRGVPKQTRCHACGSRVDLVACFDASGFIFKTHIDRFGKALCSGSGEIYDPVADEVERRRVKREADEREARRPVPNVTCYSLGELANKKIEPRRAVLTRGDGAVVQQGDIFQVFAYRGIGKTWFMQTLAVTAGYGGEGLGYRAPERWRVLYIDGEMRIVDIQKRFALLTMQVKPEILTDPTCGISIIAADQQEDYLPKLDTLEGQEAIEPQVDKADLILIDSRSCLMNPAGEKDPEAWQAAQDYLLSLRRRGKTTGLVHHANRQGGARGISKTEDVLDTVIKLSRPEEYVSSEGACFKVEYDKARGLWGAAAAPFVTAFKDGVWVEHRVGGDQVEGRILAQVRAARSVGEPLTSANAISSRVRGNRVANLEAISNLLKSGELVKLKDGFDVPEKAQMF